ncbi:hypothetical protein O6H91_04G122000 [Diphasiastrum complanatum]|uniref:Uncharacterized protein n=1 Tax=Diphasiastrum complanatum TaxID=34168 RepID=A0ACC2E1G0_DIPCM|nr:hypothetical protein O6H91_04G122000 [Diphasiastrum complanatum]
MRIVKFVTRKRRVLTLFRTFSRLDLKKPTPTRFSFFFLVLERLCVLRDHLRRMVSSEAFDEFRNCTTEAMFFQAIVFAEDFWTRASEIVEVLRPVFYVLRLVDREGCTLGLIYKFMDRIGEALHRCGLQEDRKDELLTRWEARWDYFHRPIHAVAHMLHPLWCSTRRPGDTKLHRGWVEYTERVWPGTGTTLGNIERDMVKFEWGLYPFDRE